MKPLLIMIKKVFVHILGKKFRIELKSLYCIWLQYSNVEEAYFVLLLLQKKVKNLVAIANCHKNLVPRCYLFLMIDEV